MTRLWIPCYLYITLMGCSMPQATPPANDALSSENTLDTLAVLEKSRAWQQAYIGYRGLLAKPDDEITAEDARLGAARCLIAMDQCQAALVMLTPLPAKASNDRERRRLALAAEAMLRLGVWAHAESLAELALSNLAPEPTQDTWAAACSANLAKAYLENDKPAQSAAMYRLAARRFQAADRSQAATACMALALEIEKALGGLATAPQAPKKRPTEK
jgi:hypothetical protein